MRFEWDEAKNRSNFKKHRLKFETATLAFEDPYAIHDLDRIVDHEERWRTLGNVSGAIVAVAHTWWEDDNGEDVIRIISARKATPGEGRVYEDDKRTS